MCLTLATYLPYLLLLTETEVLSRELHMQKTQHAVVHTHTNLRVSSFCVGHARREFEIPPPWPKLGTNGPNFGHPDISVTNSPILTFMAQMKANGKPNLLCNCHFNSVTDN